MLTSPPSAKVFKFLSTLSLRRATTRSKRIILNQIFLSTLSLRRATAFLRVCASNSWDFYPRSPCGERHLSAVSRPHAAYFYPRSPCGERLERPVHPYIMLEFLSTLSLRRATVSQLFRTKAYREDFYPRSPCGERPPLADGAEPHAAFLSTLSLRRATRYIYICIKLCFNFYPRSPCGERPVHHRRRVLRYDISIHALLAESDAPKLRLRVPFLISIHALLAESDSTQKGSTPTAKTFLSTLSLRRATPPRS